MVFDSNKFSTDQAKNLATSVGSKISEVFSNNLLNSNFSLNSIRSVLADKVDSVTNYLKGDTSLSGTFNRITPEDLYTARSIHNSDPVTKVSQSQEGQTVSDARFPPDLNLEEFMRIEFVKYDRPSALDPVNFDCKYRVDLPLPRQLTETHSVQLSPQETGTLGAGINNVNDIINKIQNKGDSNSGGIGDDLINTSGFAYGMVRNQLQGSQFLGLSGEQAVGTFGQLVGAIPNPHISVFFNGVDIRPAMEFSWLFSARNSAESAQIKNIINQFKKRVLPSTAGGQQNLMVYPELVKITLHPWNEGSTGPIINQTMPTYKYGLIEAINVNYTPSGLALFKDPASSPVFVVFSFLFQEVEVFTGNDYGSTVGKDIEERVNQDVSAVKNFIGLGK